MTRLHLLASLLVVSLAGAAGAAEPFAFVRLGELPGGAYFDVPEDLSPDGRFLVGCCFATAPYPADSQALLWSAEDGIVPLGVPAGGAWSSNATGVSGGGSVVVGHFTPSAADTSHVLIFRWTAATGMVSLGDLAGGLPLSGAHAVTADGATMVGSGYATPGSRGFRRGPTGGFQLLHPAVPGWSGANDVSDDGAIAVGWGGSTGSDTATLWGADGLPQVLGLLPGARSSYAEAVSNDGAVVVGSSGVDGEWQQAFDWSEGVMRALPHLPTGFYGGARDTSEDGSITVGSEAIGDRGAPEWDYRAVLWDFLHGPRDLNTVVSRFGVELDGWRLVTANAVSGDGRSIAGTLQRGYGAAREFQAYYLHLPPECSDGIDNDADGRVDFGADRHCSGELDDLERLYAGCGLLGPELLLPVMLLRRHRGRGARRA